MAVSQSGYSPPEEGSNATSDNLIEHEKAKNKFAECPVSTSTADTTNAPGTPLGLRLLSINMFVRPPGINNNGNDYKDERIAELIARMALYEVVCLQEMFSVGSTRQRRLLAAARRLGFLYSLTSPFPVYPPFLVDGGLVVLSRYRILAHDHVVYPRGTVYGADAFAAKGAIYALVEVVPHHPDSRFHLFVTHLQTKYTDPTGRHWTRNAKFEAVRKRQLKVLNDFVNRKRCESEYPCILVGDFNVNSRPKGSGGVLSSKREDAADRESLDSGEYVQMMKAIDPAGRMRDVLKEAHGGVHPVTFGDLIETESGRVPRDRVLTHRNELGSEQSIDYILFLPGSEKPPAGNGLPHTPTSTAATPAADADAPVAAAHCRACGATRCGAVAALGAVSGITPVRARVEPFFITGRPFGQISDHYGVECWLEYSPAAGCACARRTPLVSAECAWMQEYKGPRRDRTEAILLVLLAILVAILARSTLITLQG